MPIDYKRYPTDWKSRIVPEVLERAKDKCECCGRENKSSVYSSRVFTMDGYQTAWTTLPLSDTSKKVTIVLTVAHLDHDEHNQNVSLDRLKAMCQLCHLRYDAEEKRRRRAVK